MNLRNALLLFLLTLSSLEAMSGGPFSRIREKIPVDREGPGTGRLLTEEGRRRLIADEIEEEEETPTSSENSLTGEVPLHSENLTPPENHIVPSLIGTISTAKKGSDLVATLGVNSIRETVFSVDQPPCAAVISYLRTPYEEKQLKRYQNELGQCKTEGKRLRLTKAVDIVKYASSYYNGFIRAQIKAMERLSGLADRAIEGKAKLDLAASSISPTIQPNLNTRLFLYTITNLLPLVEKTILKVTKRAENVMALSSLEEQIAEIEKNLTPLSESARNDLANKIEKTRSKIKDAVNDQVSYAEKVARADFSQAKSISEKNSYLIAMQECAKTLASLYSSLSAAPGLPANYFEAARVASSAAQEFEQAAKTSIPAAKDAWTQAGKWYLESASLIVNENSAAAERYFTAASRAKLAAQTFEQAAVCTPAAQAACTQEGKWYLEEATATAKGDLAAAKRYSEAASKAFFAVLEFQRAADTIVPEAQAAWTQAGKWYLESASLIVNGNSAEAERYFTAASTASYAAGKFEQAPDIIVPEVKDASTQAGKWYLESASLIANGNSAAAERYRQAAFRATNAAEKFAWAAQAGEPVLQYALTEAGKCYLKSATATAKGDLATAKRDLAAAENYANAAEQVIRPYYSALSKDFFINTAKLTVVILGLLALVKFLMDCLLKR